MNEKREANAKRWMAERIRLSTENERIKTKTETDVRTWVGEKDERLVFDKGAYK